jgi:MoaA/NifB/PqqE/SkfB family radical SAM enzyme
MKTGALGRVLYPARLYPRWRKCIGYKPLLLKLLVTSRCNSRCMHCNIWRLTRERPQVVEDELSTQQWMDLLRELSEMGTEEVFISGGEPLLRRDTLEIVTFAKEKGMQVEMVTNGTLVNESLAKELVLSGLDIIDFSLDGPSSEIHAEFRGVDGAWERTTRGIELLNQARRDLGAQKPVIQVSYPVSTITHQHIEQVVRLKPKLGYDALHFNPIIGKTPGARSVFMTDDDLRNLEARLDSITAAFQDAGMSSSPLWNLVRMCRNAEAAKGGKYAESFIRRVLCFAPWEEVTVDPFGNVYPCPYACPFQNLSEDLEHCFWGTGDFKMGNLKSSGFREIWNGESYRRFRKNLRKVPSLPFCAWCCEATLRDAVLTGLFKDRSLLFKIALSRLRHRSGRSERTEWEFLYE